MKSSAVIEALTEALASVAGERDVLASELSARRAEIATLTAALPDRMHARIRERVTLELRAHGYGVEGDIGAMSDHEIRLAVVLALGHGARVKDRNNEANICGCYEVAVDLAEPPTFAGAPAGASWIYRVQGQPAGWPGEKGNG